MSAASSEERLALHRRIGAEEAIDYVTRDLFF